MNESWNYGGSVTEAEKNDHIMNAADIVDAVGLLAQIENKAFLIRKRLERGAPCAAEKTLNDLAMAIDYLNFVFARFEGAKEE